MDSSPQQSMNTPGSHTKPADVLIAGSQTVFAPKNASAHEESPIAIDDGRTIAPNETSLETFATHVHNYVNEYIRFADQKAAIIFALSSGLLCYLFEKGIHKMWYKAPDVWTSLDLLCLLGMSALAAAFLVSCWAITPNLRRTHRGLVFFLSISKYDASRTYATEVLSAHGMGLTRALLQHTYDLSLVCKAKYWKVGLAIGLASLGVALTVVVLLFRP